MPPRLDFELPRFHPGAVASASIGFAFAVAAILVGYVIASGKPVPILLAFGTIVGIALLNALGVVVWTILVGVLLVSGPVVMFVPSLEKIGWLFSLLGFFLTGAAILYPAIGQRRFQRPLPTFVILAIVLFVYGLLSITYSGDGLFDGVKAGKRYFQFFGLLFILSAVAFSENQIRRWWVVLLVISMIQLPFALYQRIALAPMLEGMGGGVYALDIVVGTMEGSVKGGGSSSVMALLLVFALASFLALYREKALSGKAFIPLALVVVAPLPLGEVKLLVLLLPLALIAVFFDLIRKRPILFFSAAVIALVVTGLVGWTYLAINSEPGVSTSDLVDNAIAYNFGQQGYYGRGLNRTTVYSYWFSHQDAASPLRTLFGNGLGSAFSGVGENAPGYMERAHSGIFIGLTSASTILWDLGIVGLLLLLGIQFSAVRHAFRIAKEAAPGVDRAFCRSLSALSLMLVTMTVHSDALMSVPSLEVLSAFCMGAIAWRWRSTRERNTRYASARPVR